MIDLALADLKFPPPRGVLRELVREISMVNFYPSGDYLELKRAFCDYLRPKVSLAIENVVFGNGLDEVIDLVTRVWGGVNLIPMPTFSQYSAAAARSNQKVISSGMLQQGKYELDFDEADLKRASLVWICNPNNPTGDLIPRRKIEQAIDSAKGMVAVDECYYEYTGKTVVDLVKDYDNLIVLRSFSKNFGIAGLRLGVAISSRENIMKIEKIRQPFNVNRFAEKAGVIVLRHADEYKKIWQRVLKIGKKFAAEVKKMGYRPFPVNANFVLVDFLDERKASEAYLKLKNSGIKTYPGWSEEDFEGDLNQHIRFAVGAESDMELAVKILKG
ncbi:MAG: pyridoxal phosphate-dependent aminotransferase [Candidatus Hadarchaeum sp.]|uniref:pyridoxal phosphate-dependent aminotransferase n=1 Tax=Candidatus Hadarchaeum sp. TaxID=2883567 RepID=UPI003D149408